MVNKTVTRFRQRIFRATRNGEYPRLRQLQRLACSSEAVLLYSIRHVTYGSGNNTAGIDGRTAITPEERVNLYLELKSLDLKLHNPLSARRTYLKKPDGRLRPIGIPTIVDRVLQMIVKVSLEPEWEAYFESSSYGFRPKRSVNDAINRIFVSTNKENSRKWVVDADVSLCFDSISHTYLMEALRFFPYRSLIERWLNSGVSVGDVWFDTEEGTPQGGVLSPLLCNIAMHGMEKELGITMINSQKGYVNPKGRLMVRFADDFVVLCHTRDDAYKVLEQLDTILGKRGLKVSKAKTRVVHIAQGFDFLGFHIQMRARDKRYAKEAIVPLDNGEYQIDYGRVGIYIQPSDKSINKLKETIKSVFKETHGSKVDSLISKLNPIIRGWANSKRYWHSNRTFHDLDQFLYDNCWAWAHRQHPNKNSSWVKDRYFKHLKLGPINNKWVFSSPGERGLFLYQFKWFGVEMHIMVKNNACPDDPSQTEYWIKLQSERAEYKRFNILNRVNEQLSITQDHLCPICGESLYNGETIHKHHILESSKGGKSTPSNLILLHLACHYQVHHSKGEMKEKLIKLLQASKCKKEGTNK